MRYRTRVRLRYDALVTETDTLLAGLNPVQREAASAPDGPILVIAGAGSGKTRVLTHRVAFLVAEKRVSPFGLLAITFTNKAAGEMKERVADLVGPVAHRMWVSTFHSACARILRRDAPVLGYRSSFSIYDQSDAVRLTDYVRRDLDLDPKRFPARRLHGAISALKNELVTPEEAHDRAFTPARVPGRRGLPRVSAPAARRVGRRLRRPARAHRAPVPRAPRRARALARTASPRCSSTSSRTRTSRSGSSSACSPKSTATCSSWVTRISASSKVRRSRWATARAARSSRCAPATTCCRATAAATSALHGSCVCTNPSNPIGIAITTQSGRRIVSTPEHVHFAGFVIGRTPQQYMTYVMWKEGMGFRVGTSRTYTRAQVKVVFGPAQRSVQEHADAVWVVGTHATEVGEPPQRGRACCSVRHTNAAVRCAEREDGWCRKPRRKPAPTQSPLCRARHREAWATTAD